MCNSFNKTQQRLRARRRASRNKPAQQGRRTMLIARAVWGYRLVMDALGWDYGTVCTARDPEK